MKDQLKVGFIGFGNMARAMADGFLQKGALKGEQMCACAKHWEGLCENTRARGMYACRDAAEVAQWSDIVIAAVKPYLIQEVLEPIKDKLAGKILVSVAAGFVFEKYEAFLLPGTAHLSTVPNTPVSIGEGIIICESRHSLNDEQLRIVEELLSSEGLVEFVDTKQMGIAGTISGCGPAFTAMYIEALADAGVFHGLPRRLAYQLASQMVAGTGKLQLETGEHPGAMKDAVCSPGGTTIRGVAALEHGGFRAAVMDAVDAAEK